MRQQITGRLAALQRTFMAFTTGQKTVAIIGSIALLAGAFFVYRWAATPSYAPLFTNISPTDASAVVDQLETEGTPYKLTDGGATIMVPRPDVYDTRIKLSGEGLPTDDSDGYAILDKQDLSTSQFQEQTGYKRAMEGELQKTIEALNPVQTAVVHIAMPQEELFADEQKPTTASVLVESRPGSTLDPEQVQAVVHLVASSVEGLDPDQVTVADSTGQVLSTSGEGIDTMADTRSQQVNAFEQKMTGSVQDVLDRVLGAGNTAVQVTGDLNFDQTVTDTTRYFTDPNAVPLSASKTTEKYAGPGAASAGGVVGPDGTLTPNNGNGAGSSYQKKQSTSDNAVGQTVEKRTAAPGSVKSLHVGIVLDTKALAGRNPEEIRRLVSSSVGIDPQRGDTVQVSVLPFDRSAEKAAKAEIAAAKAADDKAQMMSWLKTGGLILVIAGIFLAAWFKGRKRRKARDQATTYVVEQLRRDAIDRPQPAFAAVPAAPLAIGGGDHDLPDLTGAARDEISALVERQPEEVAQLLRGWLVDHGN